MKIALSIAVFVFLILLFLVARQRSQAPGATKSAASDATASGSKNVYEDLRGQALHGSRAKFGLPPGSGPNDPWGVVMDWGVEKGTVTVVALLDGSASVYFSSGGGFIGDAGQEPIRQAAQRAVAIAGETPSAGQLTTTFPLPQRGGVILYILTDSGVYMSRTTQQELKSTSHPLSKLGDAMQNVITEYRLGSETKKADSN